MIIGDGVLWIWNTETNEGLLCCIWAVVAILVVVIIDASNMNKRAVRALRVIGLYSTAYPSVGFYSGVGVTLELFPLMRWYD